jgi:bifunctional DNA-binding transcriptional regulator/antitoxin component of YhaV-PrlF toxin-antitoxin module
MITSKLTSKSQTTISQPIRGVLSLREGDDIVCEIRDDYPRRKSRNQPTSTQSISATLRCAHLNPTDLKEGG